LSHLTTLDADGSSRVSAVWFGIEGDDIVIGHLMGGAKTRNIARDPRVALTVEGAGSNAIGMTNYLVVCGRACLVEGGAPELLQRRAAVYLGPDVKFPPDGRPAGGSGDPPHPREVRRRRTLGAVRRAPKTTWR
jgi:PPOX class probable F420-dependent enzyme